MVNYGTLMFSTHTLPTIDKYRRDSMRTAALFSPTTHEKRHMENWMAFKSRIEWENKGQTEKSLFCVRTEIQSIWMKHTLDIVSRMKWAFFSGTHTHAYYFLHRRKGDNIALHAVLRIGTNCDNTTSKFVHAYLFDTICIYIYIYIYRSLTAFWLWRFSMVLQNLFHCKRALTVGDDGAKRHAAHMQRQWLHWKSQPIALSASIEIKKNQSNNGTHTRTFITFEYHFGPDQSVCSASTVNLIILFGNGSIEPGGHVCARAREPFLRSDFSYIHLSFFYFIFFCCPFSIKNYFSLVRDDFNAFRNTK